MSVIYVLIPIAALITAIAIYIFFWAVKTDQFDDLEKQGMSILFDEEDKKQQESSKNKSQSKISTVKDTPNDKKSLND